MTEFIFFIGCFIIALIIVAIPFFTITLWEIGINSSNEGFAFLLILCSLGTALEVLILTTLLFRYFRG